MTKIMTKDKTRRTGQFLSLLKKDLKLILTKKALLAILLMPFIMMFMIICLPTLFEGSARMTITIHNADVGSLEQHVNGTAVPMNLGADAVANIENLFKDDKNIKVRLVSTRTEALSSSNGISIPENFTAVTFDGYSSFEYYTSESPSSIQASYFGQALAKIEEAVVNGFLFLNLEAENPNIIPSAYYPPMEESEGWQATTTRLAEPFSFIICLLAILASGMSRLFGFDKEKEDGTLETLLTITKNRSHLILSKLLTGTIAAILAILSYFIGALTAGYVNSLFTGDSDMFMIFTMEDFLSGKVIVLLIGLVISLAFVMNVIITLDSILPKLVSPQIGMMVMMIVGNLFLFPVLFNPESTFAILHINPFYWIYHSFLAMIDLSFGWVDALYLGLFVALFAGLIIISTRFIAREKVLYT